MAWYESTFETKIVLLFQPSPAIAPILDQRLGTEFSSANKLYASISILGKSEQSRAKSDGRRMRSQGIGIEDARHDSASRERHTLDLTKSFGSTYVATSSRQLSSQRKPPFGQPRLFDLHLETRDSPKTFPLVLAFRSRGIRRRAGTADNEISTARQRDFDTLVILEVSQGMRASGMQTSYEAIRCDAWSADVEIWRRWANNDFPWLWPRHAAALAVQIRDRSTNLRRSHLPLPLPLFFHLPPPPFASSLFLPLPTPPVTSVSFNLFASRARAKPNAQFSTFYLRHYDRRVVLE